MARVHAAGQAAPAPAPAAAAATPAAPAPAPDAPKPAAAAPVDLPKPAEPAKPAADDKPDPAAERGLRAVEQQRKKLLDEQNAWKVERETQAAELARLRKEAEGRVSSREELKKLSPTELLDALDFTEDDHDILARAAYARTKAGKTDPRAQQAAQEGARSQASRELATRLEARVAELEAKLQKAESDLRGEFTRRDHAVFAERWVGEAVKAIPSDKPTFLSKLYANEPDTARRELLTIGAELEKANDGQPPTQAEVIDEFEKRKRAAFKAMGIDADALLAPPPKPAAPAPAKAAPARTLDTTAPNVTRPANLPQTRDERRQAAMAKIRDSKRLTADQTP